MNNEFKVLIDGDGCPVIKETIAICKEKGIEVIVFMDTSHIFNDSYAKVITVDKGNDSVDFALVNKAKDNDIVVTQDYGLASMALAKKARAISQNGLIYDSSNIDGLLARRHFAQMARRKKKNHRYKGPKKRKNSDNINFVEQFKGVLNNET